MTKTETFKDFVQNRGITKISTKIETFFKDFDQNGYFSEILTKIRILGYLEQNRDVSNIIGVFRKSYRSWNFNEFWPESLFWGKFSKIDIFENFDQYQDFSTVWDFEIFRKFDQNRDFSKIWPKWDFSKIVPQIDTFENFDQIEVVKNYSQKINIFEIVFFSIFAKIEMIRKFLLQSRFFKQFD